MSAELLSLFVGIVMLLVSMATPAAPDAQQQGWLRHLVLQDCGACHGLTLKGGLGPALTADKLQNRSPEVLYSIIMNGVAGTPMPPWKAILDKHEVAWLVRQLKAGAIAAR